MPPKTILITGANRGIGLALTKAFAKRDYQVFATCRYPDEADNLNEMANKLPNVVVKRLDVTDQASIRSLADVLKETPLDILLNNAGLLNGSNDCVTAEAGDPSQLLENIKAEAFLKILQTNTVAPLMITQAFLPHLRKGKCKCIVMMSSRWGSIELMDESIPLCYGTSKAALNAVTKNISCALAGEGFITVALNPGSVATDMGGQGADWTPDECAQRLLPIIEGLTPGKNGTFIRHTGEFIPW